MPRTRWSPSSEPKGPAESRAAMIRAARAGPIPGSRSNSSAEARSGSMGPTRSGKGFTLPEDCAISGAVRPCVDPAGVGVDRRACPLGRRPPAAMAESTAASWAARAARLVGGGAEAGDTARQPRTPSPRAATAATKRRALRSAGVGTSNDGAPHAAVRHQFRARRVKAARQRRAGPTRPGAWAHMRRITASATSPTTCRVCGETLSSVSSGV